MKGAIRFWPVVIIWVGILMLSLSSLCRAEGWVPSAENALALDQGRDCTLFRRLARQAQSDLQLRRGLLSGHLDLLKQKREELERCGKEKGIGSIGGVGGRGMDAEQRLAEVCPAAYEAWVAPGYRMQMDKQDIRSAKHDLERATEVITERCGPMPLQVSSRKLY